MKGIKRKERRRGLKCQQKFSMAGLVIGKVMELMVLAVLLVAPATSQSHLELVTENNTETFSLPSTSPALTVIKFSKDTHLSNTQAGFQIKYSLAYASYDENFKIGQDDDEKRNMIIVLYNSLSYSLESRKVLNMLTCKENTLSWKIQHMAVWSEQRVRWQVFHNDPAFLNTSTPDPSALAMNTTLPSTPSSPYLSPAFVTLASLCILFALSTLVLSILLCLRCAFARNGLGQAASSSDSTTFKSTEALVTDQAYFPYNYNGRGSLHISENSLYGVI